MGIQVLPPQVANQIAAGEVVERPSAVVKELVENAFDAGATKVQVEIEQGGAKLILVRDNGSGIKEAELPLALKRHATSKLQSIEDLDYLSSMGFRGEALASVAAVSRLSLTSRTEDESFAHVIRVDGIGQLPVVEPAAHPIGTTVEVVDLFFNTPARRRFMRSEKSEFLQIEEIFRRLALSRPDCALSLKNNGRMVYDFKIETENTKPNRRMSKIFGNEFAENACKVDAQDGDLCMRGFCAIAESARPIQYFFVNGRIVKDKVIIRAVSDAYEEVLGRKVADSYVCFLTMPQAEVDINVHPQKYEVRFQEARKVHDFIAGALVNALRNSTQLFPEVFAETAQVPLAHNYCDVTPIRFDEKQAALASSFLDSQGEKYQGRNSQGERPDSLDSGLKLGQGADSDLVGLSENKSNHEVGNYSASVHGAGNHSVNLDIKSEHLHYSSEHTHVSSRSGASTSSTATCVGGHSTYDGYNSAEKKANIVATSSYYDRIFSRPRENVNFVPDFLNENTVSPTTSIVPAITEQEEVNISSGFNSNSLSISNPGVKGDLWGELGTSPKDIEVKSSSTLGEKTNSDMSFQGGISSIVKENVSIPELALDSGDDGLPAVENNAFFAPWFHEVPIEQRTVDLRLALVTQKHYALVTRNSKAYLWDLAELSKDIFKRYLGRERAKLLATSNLIVPVELACEGDIAGYLQLLKALGFTGEIQNGRSLVIKGVPKVMRCMNVARIIDEILQGLVPGVGERQILEFFADVLCTMKMPLYFTAEMAERLLKQVSEPLLNEGGKIWREVKFESLVKELFSE